MARNFIRVDRDQSFLLPPDMREWLPEDDLVWVVLEAVDQCDLSAFTAVYREDGQGRPAFDPAMMVALLLYAYCHGVRSSREIERRCVRDVAVRVIAAGYRPDHATIARFRARHEAALQSLFTEVLRLCAEAGLVRLALLAVDGTKVGANASWSANRTLEQLEAQIAEASAAMLADAAAADAAENEQFGPARGDQLPEPMRTRTGRAARLAEARDQLTAAGVKPTLRTVVADSGYVTEAAFAQAHQQRLRLLAPLGKDTRQLRDGGDPADGQDLTRRPETARGQRRLRHWRGRADYKQRGRTVEPVFGRRGAVCAEHVVEPGLRRRRCPAGAGRRAEGRRSLRVRMPVDRCGGAGRCPAGCRLGSHWSRRMPPAAVFSDFEFPVTANATPAA